MIKKRGSLLIENIFAMAILVMVIMAICEVIISNSKWKIIKSKEDEFSRITYCMEQELKYNMTIEEVKDFCGNKVIALKKDGILKELTYKNLKDIERGDDVTITIKELSQDRIEIFICLKEECYGNNVESDRSFIKDRVMNEYYK